MRQRRGRPKRQQPGTKQVFVSEAGWKVTVSANRKGSYHEIKEALQQALEEVCLRIENNVQLF